MSENEAPVSPLPPPASLPQNQTTVAPVAIESATSTIPISHSAVPMTTAAAATATAANHPSLLLEQTLEDVEEVKEEVHLRVKTVPFVLRLAGLVSHMLEDMSMSSA